MAVKKKITKVAKLQFIAGQARPGPALAGVGIRMPEFTRAFNDQTKDRGKEPVPVAVTVYADKSFDFKLFTAPASYKLLQIINKKSGSANSKTDIIGTITVEQLREIAEYKLPDLNTDSVESAMRVVAGTARNMGILIEGWDDVEKARKEALLNKKQNAIAKAREQKLEDDLGNLVSSKGVAVEVVTHKDDEVKEKVN